MAHEIFRLDVSFTQPTGMRQGTTILVYFLVSKKKQFFFIPSVGELLHRITVWQEGLEVQPRNFALENISH